MVRSSTPRLCHTRNTDIGQFQVVCNDTPKTHTAEFIVLATATPTPTNTPTATPTPTTVPCSLEPYDFNDDGAIDIIDISMVSSRWMDPALYDPAFDVAPAGDPDELIDIADISAVAVRFGQSCP